jgi:hypothetical protein
VAVTKQQFAVVSKDGTIEAIVLIRGEEFYCYELHEDAPKNMKEAQKEFPGCDVVPLKLTPSKL